MKYEVLRSGQPRSYADSELVVRLHFESPVTEQEARRQAMEGSVGYTATTKQTAEGWWSTYLEYFRKADDDGQIWEFKTVTPFTD